MYFSHLTDRRMKRDTLTN